MNSPRDIHDHMKTNLLSAIAALAISCSLPAVAKADETVVLAPSSQWQLNYAEDSCRLGRSFGEGEQKSLLYFERYEPSDGFMMVAAGEPLSSRSRNNIKFRFGPAGDAEWREREVGVGDIGGYKPALIFSTTTLVPLENVRENGDFARDFDPERDAEMQLRVDVSPETEQAIEWLEIKRARAAPVRFELGSMGEPMAALRQCTDELLGHWGIDVAAHKELTRPVVPASNPGRWLSSKDYPADLLRAGEQGIVKFRLSVDAAGKPTQCHIQKSTRPEGFDDAVCKALMRNAEFEPALDKNGEPIASYWHSTVRFQV